MLSSSTILQQMDSLWVQLVRGRDFPDLIVADNNTYKYYLNALQSIQRIQTENGAPDMAEAGFQSLKYLNSDVVLDGGFQGFQADPLPPQLSSSTSAVGGAPATTMYFLNTKYLNSLGFFAVRPSKATGRKQNASKVGGYPQGQCRAKQGRKPRACVTSRCWPRKRRCALSCAAMRRGVRKHSPLAASGSNISGTGVRTRGATWFKPSLKRGRPRADNWVNSGNPHLGQSRAKLLKSGRCRD